MKDLTHTLNGKQVHETVQDAINNTLLQKMPSGAAYYYVSKQTVVTLDDEHTRYHWELTENMTQIRRQFPEEQGYDPFKITRPLIDQLGLILQITLIKKGYNPILENGTLSIYHNSYDDLVMIQFTDSHAIIDVNYSGQY